ncbi:hypothetical protein KIN20_003748 [Parelaphostrongylus tenuis]|uniref:Uncharacterized protein n=1 Tax=Parelaphostrongylus tenuis TaxID=148309 RepID=A0AAD5QDY0_PARTN|nr:hypothetical protein KIN20_003748 [Parelaphostrongylus tenuis]
MGAVRKYFFDYEYEKKGERREELRFEWGLYRCLRRCGALSTNGHGDGSQTKYYAEKWYVGTAAK